MKSRARSRFAASVGSWAIAVAAAALVWTSAANAAESANKRRVPGVVVEGSRVFDPERDGDPVVNHLERRTFPGFERFHAHDPAGNRVEVLSTGGERL